MCPSGNKIYITSTVLTFDISTWPVGQGKYIGEEMVRVRVVFKCKWTQNIFIGEVQLHTGRDYLPTVPSI